jgi:preprotein translocase subunit SecB
MAEDSNGAAPQAPQPAQVKMNVLAQFVRDMSFENVVAQKGVASNDVQPETQVQVSLDARKRTADNQYEVITKFKITSSNAADKAPLFLLELDYGGIFHVEGVPAEQMHPFLLIECPRMLFPFMRRIVADVTRDGGFAPFYLETIDFLSLYRAELARRAEQQPSVAAQSQA